MSRSALPVTLILVLVGCANDETNPPQSPTSGATSIGGTGDASSESGGSPSGSESSSSGGEDVTDEGSSESGGTTTGAGEHDNFDMRASRDDCVASYPLRDPQEVDEYDHGQYAPSTVTYDPEADAARITLPEGDTASAQQIWLPVPDTATGVGQKLSVVWEWRASPNWTAENGLNGHKMFQVRADDHIWYEVGTSYMPLPDGTTRVSRIRSYTSLGPGTHAGPFDIDGVHYDSDAVGPILANAFVPRDTWIRFGAEFDRRDDGFVYVTYVVSVPGEEPLRVHEELAWGLDVASRITSFQYETNSSQPRTAPGPEVWCFARNVTMHLDVPVLEDLL